MSQSADDALEDTRQGKLNYNVGANRLPEDNDRPAAPADGQNIPDEDPRTEGVDPHEAYDSGKAGDNE